MQPGEVMALMAVVAGFLILGYPIVRAIAKRISGEHRRPGMELEEREEILAELHQVRQELGELAERMDFAERLLTKQSEVKER
jgi:Tfp pilus assembly protein PilO